MKIRLHDRPVNTAWVRALWLVIALLLLAGGIFSVTRHEENLVSASRILGGIMFAAGFLNFSVCEGKNRKLHGAHWLMADGLVAVFLSLFPLFNQMTQPLVIPFFFGVWELVSGILKIMDSAELKAEKLRCWMGFAFIGDVELLSGGMSVTDVSHHVGFRNLCHFSREFKNQLGVTPSQYRKQYAEQQLFNYEEE